MPQWAGSFWYYIAYLLKNDDGPYTPLDSKEAKKRFERWLPVDVYILVDKNMLFFIYYMLDSEIDFYMTLVLWVIKNHFNL